MDAFQLRNSHTLTQYYTKKRWHLKLINWPLANPFVNQLNNLYIDEYAKKDSG